MNATLNGGIKVMLNDYFNYTLMLIKSWLIPLTCLNCFQITFLKSVLNMDWWLKSGFVMLKCKENQHELSEVIIIW